MDYHCCPECGGNRIQQKRTAQTIGQVVGAIGGIAVGMLLPFPSNRLPAPKLPQQALQYLTFAKTGSLVGAHVVMNFNKELIGIKEIMLWHI